MVSIDRYGLLQESLLIHCRLSQIFTQRSVNTLSPVLKIYRLGQPAKIVRYCLLL